MFGTKEELVERIAVLTGLSLTPTANQIDEDEYEMRTATGFSVGHVTLYRDKARGWRVASSCGAEFIRIFNDIK